MFKESLSGALMCGELEFIPFTVFEYGESHGDYTEILGNKCYHLSCETKEYRDILYITECASGYTVKREFKNTTSDVMHLRELGITLKGIDFCAKTESDYYYHLETPRHFGTMTFTVDRERPKDMLRIGTSPFQPFPAILVSNYNVKNGIVHGTLSQKVFYHNYMLSHAENTLTMEIYSSFKDISYREVLPNEVLVDEWYIGRAEHADDIERVFEEYTVHLRKKLPANYGATSINRDNMVWGTWNDGITRSVNETLILTEAKTLKEYFPTVRWIQIDDGYCAFNENIAHGLGVPYEKDEGVDKVKFPHGMRYVTDKIRQIGLRPALWIGGFCPKNSKISRERPEIMADYASRRTQNYLLDVSIQEAREYMTSAIETMILDWGFDGVKHDFWSYAFEVSEPLLKNNYASGYEHRRWWLNEIRKRLPDDGYLQTGCDIVMANPFLGTHFTNYRYGIDIGSGKWSNIKTNFLWGAACFATHTGDLFVPNSDAVGMFPGLSDIDARFCVNYVLITRTMVELAGKLSEADKSSPRFAMLKKATCNVNNGQDVYFAGYDYRADGTKSPDTLYIRTPHFSKQQRSGAPMITVAIFNTEETENKTLTLKASQLGLDPCEKYVITDVWSGEQYELLSELDFELVPHDSRLLSVNSSKGRQIYDANIELTDINAEENRISARTSYAMDDALITLSHLPNTVLFDGKELEFSQEGGVIRISVPNAGLLEIVF